jgi:hypothetical protein
MEAFLGNSLFILSSMGARGSLVVEVLCYKPEGHGFITRYGEFFSISVILPTTLGPEVHSASNINEYLKQKNNYLGSSARSVCKADNVTTICELTA